MGDRNHDDGLVDLEMKPVLSADVPAITSNP